MTFTVLQQIFEIPVCIRIFIVQTKTIKNVGLEINKL